MAAFVFRLALVTIPALALPLSPYASNTTEGGIAWTDCDDFLPKTMLCANVSVPINWDAPQGETFNLRVAKLSRRSNNTVKRIGSLFINPGGPGESAIVTVAYIEQGMIYDENVISDIRDRFDIIGVDPRGVTRTLDSVGSVCDWNIWNERVSLFPQTREEYDRLVDKNRRLGESCLKMTGQGDFANHLDTLSTVKDLEEVRKQLGEKLNWLGLSYGTQIGAQYAQLFPDNIRLMVLDGMVQHSQSEASNILIESTAYSAALKSFFQWAGTNDASPLKGQDVEKLWYSLLKNATETPIPAPNCPDWCRSDVNAEEIMFNAQAFVISADTSSRTRFAEVLLDATRGDATWLSTKFASEHGDKVYDSLTIGCQDWAPRAASFEDLQAKMRMAEVFSPLNKGASQSYMLQASCIGWPSPLNNPPAKLNIQTQSPILMVNSLRDPSTSYTWAVGMLEELENAVLLTRNGDGHTSYGTPGATTDAINKFLVTGELPAPGTFLDD